MQTPRLFRNVTLGTILLVTLVGLCVRLVGIQHGAPDMVYHPDVAKQSLVARVVYNGNLDLPGQYKSRFELSMYPYGTAIILGQSLSAFAAIAEPLGFDASVITDVHRWRWALRLRYVAVVMFMASVALFLTVERRQFSGVALAMAGLLLVLEPVNSLYSHYGMNDVPLAAVLLLAWLSAGYMDPDHPRWPVASLLTGLLLGLGFGVKYQAVYGAIFPVTAWLMALPKRNARWLYTTPLLVLGGVLVGALFSCPQLRNLPYFLEMFPKFMDWQANIMGREVPLSEKLPRNLGLLARFASMYWYWALLPPLVWATRRAFDRKSSHHLRVMCASAVAFCGLLLGTFLVARDFLRDNDMIAITSFIAVLAGYMLTAWEREKGAKAWTITAWAVAGLLALGYTVTATRDSMALRRPDTRIRAQTWCRENFPTGSKYLREWYTLPVDTPDLHEVKVRYLCSKNAAKAARAKSVDFIITSSLAHKRFFDPLSAYYDEKRQPIYAEVNEQYDKVAVFEDRALTFAHPMITVYAPR